jgi:hypothetical protein
MLTGVRKMSGKFPQQFSGKGSHKEFSASSFEAWHDGK